MAFPRTFRTKRFSRHCPLLSPGQRRFLTELVLSPSNGTGCLTASGTYLTVRLLRFYPPLLPIFNQQTFKRLLSNTDTDTVSGAMRQSARASHAHGNPTFTNRK